MMHRTVAHAGSAGNQTAGVSPAAEQWAEQLAAAGLPQRYILRLYCHARVAHGGAPFVSFEQPAPEAGLVFMVTGPIVGLITARAGDQLVVTPLDDARKIVLLRTINGRMRTHRVLPDSVLALLPALERGGAVELTGCHLVSATGSVQ